MVQMVEMNWVTIAVAALSSVLLGFIYYCPCLMGKQCEAACAPNLGEKKKCKYKSAFMSYIGSFLMATGLYWLMMALDRDTFAVTWCLVVGIWVSFVLPIVMSSVIWEHRSCKLQMINAVYYLLSLMLMSLVILNLPMMMS